MNDSIFKIEFVVRPCENGSFVVLEHSVDRGTIGRSWAFSNVTDLLAFLNAQAK